MKSEACTYNNDHRSPLLLLLAVVDDVGGRKCASVSDIVCQFSGGTEQWQGESVCVSFGPERAMFGTRSALSDPQDIGGKLHKKIIKWRVCDEPLSRLWKIALFW